MNHLDLLCLVMPARLAAPYRRFGRYGILALMGIVFFLPSVLDVLLTPVDWTMGLVDRWIRLWR